jgi:hypothetical protein
MNMIKWALLGGAALAVTASGAQADDLTALKAQMEAMQARVNQLEAAPVAPAGGSFLTIKQGPSTQLVGVPEGKGYGKNSTIISVVPTADAAPTASLEWSGYVRTILFYNDDQVPGSKADADIWVRGQLKVVGKTDTAVGEVGGRIQLRANSFETFDGGAVSTGNSNVVMNEAWGWWQFTPEMNFAGGFTGTVGNIGHGVDGACNCYGTDNADAFDFNPGDQQQFRVTYASGPISAAIALEDGPGSDIQNFNDLGVSGEIAYANDAFSGEISGFLGSGPDIINDNAYQIGAGVSFGLGDMLALSIAGAVGDNTNGVADKYYGVSALAKLTLTEAISAELGFGLKDYKIKANDESAALAGIYYSPVSELVLGLEGEYIMPSGPKNDSMQVDFVANWAFHE